MVSRNDRTKEVEANCRVLGSKRPNRIISALDLGLRPENPIVTDLKSRGILLPLNNIHRRDCVRVNQDFIDGKMDTFLESPQ